MNILNRQGLFENKCNATIDYIPVYDFAYLSNAKSSDLEDSSISSSTIHLNSLTLNWCDFVNLFFNNLNNHFEISQTNANSKPLSLSFQTFSNSFNQRNHLNLSKLILEAWSTSYHEPISNAPFLEKIKLERDCYLVKNLYSVRGESIGLSLDEIITNLLTSKQITPVNDLETSATLKFQLNLKYIFKPLKVSLNIIFSFITSIPGYTNVDSTNHSYSKDKSPIRNLYHYKDDQSETSEESSNANNVLTLNMDDNISENSDNKKNHSYQYFIDDNTIVSNNTDNVTNVSKILNSDNSVIESKAW